jgi:hypothetical protein
MFPPIYPTRASYKPLFLNSFLNICSTPQKHPAAIVALPAPSGVTPAPDCELRPKLVEVVKGRNSREMKLGIVVAMRTIRVVRRTFRRRGRLAISVCWGRGNGLLSDGMKTKIRLGLNI